MAELSFLCVVLAKGVIHIQFFVEVDFSQDACNQISYKLLYTFTQITVAVVNRNASQATLIGL